LPLSFWLLGRSPRRAILPTFAIWGVIAPAVNLWGSGSFLASLAPESARKARLDTFYPVGQRGYPYSKGFLQLDYSVGNGFKRYVDDAGRFEFRYPSEYVQVRWTLVPLPSLPVLTTGVQCGEWIQTLCGRRGSLRVSLPFRVCTGALDFGSPSLPPCAYNWSTVWGMDSNVMWTTRVASSFVTLQNMYRCAVLSLHSLPK
jgi:hypothetical protein